MSFTALLIFIITLFLFICTGDILDCKLTIFELRMAVDSPVRAGTVAQGYEPKLFLYFTFHTLVSQLRVVNWPL